MTTYEKYTAATEEYLRRLRFNNLSEKTLRNYSGTLSRFGEYLAEQPDADDLYEIVEQWRDELLESGSAASTVRQYLTNLKIFFAKACKRSFPAALRFEENPVDEDFLPKVTKKPYDEILADEDVIKLWQNSPKNSQQAHFWPRNYAVVCLILATGLRNKEVLDLTLSDVDWRDETITVRSGKGNKFRIVDAPAIVLESLTAYLDSGLRPAYLGDDDYLFGTQAQQKFGLTSAEQNTERWHRGSSQWLSELVRAHVCTVCENPDLVVRTHDLRHLFARIHLNANGNISELQSALGHAQVTTTELYSGRISPRRKRDSARAVLAARDEAAEQLKRKNEHEQTVIPLFA